MSHDFDPDQLAASNVTFESDKYEIGGRHRGGMCAVIVYAAVLCGGCGGLIGQARRAVPLDLSTPKQAALTYVQAIGQGDAATARDASIGTEDQKRWIDSVASMTGGLRLLDEALLQRFDGAAAATDAELKSALQPLAIDPVAAVDASREVVEGDTARLIAPNTFAGRRMAHAALLRKDIKGLWKVDLVALFKANPLLGREQQSASFNHYLTAGKAFRDVAAKIRSGKYRTVAEARDAIDQQLESQ